MISRSDAASIPRPPRPPERSRPDPEILRRYRGYGTRIRKGKFLDGAAAGPIRPRSRRGDRTASSPCALGPRSLRQSRNEKTKPSDAERREHPHHRDPARRVRGARVRRRRSAAPSPQLMPAQPTCWQNVMSA